ncbi:MAG TPA: winged helix-turn-helix domain-containing protein [Pyrinomonadaceae bacterium]|jgi:DNA-binding winged helix-turn-helix (wHTH) protein/TolB-like protein
MSQQTERLYEFGPFRLDPLKRRLVRDGQTVVLTSKSFDTLLALVEHRGRVLPKDELMRRLWPDTSVEENNLTQQISALRRALGERAGEHRYIVTVPGRGYSFVSDVREVADEGADLILEQRTRSRITIDVEEEHTDGHGEEQPERHETDRAAESTRTHAIAPAARRRTRARLFALVSVGLAMSLLLALFTYQRLARDESRAGGPPKSVAVLPFKSLNTDANEDLLGAGMSDTLIAKLSNVRQINVRPTSAVLKYAAADANTLAAGRELGVDAVLEGTVQRAADRVRVTVQLLDVRQGRPLWAQSFDEGLSDIFVVQDVISEQVAQALLARLNGAEQRRLRKHDTNSVAAYQDYLRGRYFWNRRDEDGLRKSVGYFEQAIATDPTYAVAYAGLADAHNLLVNYHLAGSSADESAERARAAVTKALELDDTLAEAHASLASMKFYGEHDNAAAEREYLRAVELNPNYATAHHWYSEYLAMTGRPAEAMTEIKRAQELDPLSPVINTTVGERLYFARRYGEAAEQLRRTLELSPDFYHAHYLLGLTYEQQGLYAEAVAEYQRARALAGSHGALAAGALGHVYAVTGRRREALRLLNELQRPDGDAPYPYAVATVYLGLGAKREAIEWLQKMPSADAAWLLKFDPRLDDLRAEPTFRSLLQAG